MRDNTIYHPYEIEAQNRETQNRKVKQAINKFSRPIGPHQGTFFDASIQHRSNVLSLFTAGIGPYMGIFTFEGHLPDFSGVFYLSEVFTDRLLFDYLAISESTYWVSSNITNEYANILYREFYLSLFTIYIFNKSHIPLCINMRHLSSNFTQECERLLVS